MFTKLIAVTRTDKTRLEDLLRRELTLGLGGDRPHLDRLQQRLTQATVVDSHEMLPDVITMNSTVKVRDLDPSEAETLTLVYPEETCVSEGKLSILSLLGSELLGMRVGEIVTLEVWGRELRKRVERVTFQPERVGAFNL
ncbi:Regulator of nucleoside diphosphate kinase [Stieleria maiorica]|uniref:Regulator of nucleoside diphosphate kinase n=1 Tax=Stieleria maiorica TaxID=2795974 RepID=A0A5B9M9A0_9BACT|nr:GreA/GreB family elongation factor [Stieleria maiorica]QEF97762.1 Regulator of nucleoside diphosphate kinase [Stieleria maiorica]